MTDGCVEGNIKLYPSTEATRMETDVQKLHPIRGGLVKVPSLSQYTLNMKDVVI